MSKYFENMSLAEVLRQAFAACIAMPIGVVAASSVSEYGVQDVEQSLGVKLNVKELLRCGPNALYMFLSLSGRKSIPFDELAAITVHNDGADMLTLRDVARKWGVNAELRRYKTQEIASVSVPAILQLRGTAVSLTPYHFDVMVGIDSERVHLINGTTGVPFSIRRGKLSEFWSGYALISPPRFVLGKAATVLAALMLIAVLVMMSSGARLVRFVKCRLPHERNI